MMAPSTIALQKRPAIRSGSPTEQGLKKQKKTVRFCDDDGQILDELDSQRLTKLPAHPLQIKPLGNAYDAVTNIKVQAGNFAQLPDEVLLSVLEHLDSSKLVKLGSTCKALYAFCKHDELWKALYLKENPNHLLWLGSWRSSYLGLRPSQVPPSVSCANLFSDVLYRPFQCANIPLEPFALNIPSSNQIPRLSDLTSEEFNHSWASKPFILTSTVSKWTEFYPKWTMSALLGRYPRTVFRAEAVDWPLVAYYLYAGTTTDESPLYLFDCHYASKMNLRTTPAPDFATPDLFTHLGALRPHHRWLIVGPPRSGSTFHVDPNGTSAWNAVLQGRKYWIIFPPSSPPPGIYVAADRSTVTAPLSIAEWLLTFHAEARATPGCREGVCEKGELVHVPAGWFHLVVNLLPSPTDRHGDHMTVALTANFVPPAQLPSVLEFLRDRPEQVSGFNEEVSDAYGLFRARLAEESPGMLSEAEERLEKESKKGGKWEKIKGGGEGESSGGFSFGFDDEQDEEEDDIS